MTGPASSREPSEGLAGPTDGGRGDEVELPSLPRWLGTPDSVVYAGMACWLIATIVVGVTGVGSTSTLVSCLIGLGVGVFGTAVFIVQRRSSRRGDRAAQRGLT